MYEAYLKEYPTGYYSRIAKIKLRKLERQALLKPIPEITTGQLMIRSNVSGDNVTLNGESKGSTQLDLKLKPGIYALKVSKKGYESWERTIDIKAGSEQVVYAKLKETAVVSPGTSKTLPKNGSHRTRTIRDSVTGMELVKVPKGCFQMGSNGSSKNDRPGHKVCITKDFYLGKYEVTQGQWEAIMGNNPSKLKTGNDHPVEQVSWYDVQQYIRKLNVKTGKTYRLPTEAEWEFACRSGGKDQEFCGGNHLSTYGWYGEDPKNGHHKVGGKLPNGIGLYDMSGNVWEWTCSLYKPSYNDFEKRCGNDSGNRSLRGGSWYYKPDSLRSDARGWGKPVSFRSDVGFRLFLLQSG